MQDTVQSPRVTPKASEETSDTELTALFDIGSASVGVSLVDIPKEADSPPYLRFCARIPFTFHEDLNFERFESAMLKAFKEAAALLVKEGVQKRGIGSIFSGMTLDHIVCVFASSWTVVHTSTLSAEYKKPTEITPARIGQLLSQARTHFKTSSEVTDSEKLSSERYLLEESILQVKLNEYVTHTPYGKTASKVEVGLYLSMIARGVFEKIEHILEQTFNPRDIVTHSFLLASFSVMRDLFPTEEDFILMDVGGEITDLAVIRDGMLMDTISFPHGKNFVVRNIMKKTGAHHAQAESLITAHTEISPDVTHAPKAHEGLAEAEDLWLSSFRDTLTTLSQSSALPKTIFLTADKVIDTWFLNIIRRDEFSKFTIVKQPFTVVPINRKQLTPYCHLASEKAFDSFLATEALFFHKTVLG